MYSPNLYQLWPSFPPLHPFWIVLYLTCRWNHLRRSRVQHWQLYFKFTAICPPEKEKKIISAYWECPKFRFYFITFSKSQRKLCIFLGIALFAALPLKMHFYHFFHDVLFVIKIKKLCKKIVTMLIISFTLQCIFWRKKKNESLTGYCTPQGRPLWEIMSWSESSKLWSLHWQSSPKATFRVKNISA